MVLPSIGSIAISRVQSCHLNHAACFSLLKLLHTRFWSGWGCIVLEERTIGWAEKNVVGPQSRGGEKPCLNSLLYLHLLCRKFIPHKHVALGPRPYLV